MEFADLHFALLILAEDWPIYHLFLVDTPALSGLVSGAHTIEGSGKKGNVSFLVDDELTK